jgi:outer membrane protein assembly factor BamA
LNTYYVSAGLSHQITDYLSHGLTLDRSLQAGMNQGSSYIEQLTASYAINWQLTHWVSVGLNATYTDGQQPLAVIGAVPRPVLASAQEDYQQYGGGFQVSWQLTAHVGASVSFSHLERTSNVAGRNNSDNQVRLRLNYTF